MTRIVATTENVADLELVFESRDCGNCRDGRWYGHTTSGTCFRCNGAGAKYTPAGRRARSLYEGLMREIPEVLREDVQPGDRVFVYVPRVGKRWVTIAEVHDDDMTEAARKSGIVGPDETYVSRVLTYASPKGITVHVADRTGRGYTVPRWDAQRVAAVYNQVAALKGASLRQTTPTSH